MEEIKKNFAALLKIKSLVTIVILAVFAVLALRESIDSNSVITITATVISFYFGTQHDKAKEA